METLILTQKIEQWKQVGNTIYSISNFGNIRRKYKNKDEYKELKGSKSENSYTLIGGRNYKSLPRKVYVHRFVAENFIGEIPEGYVVHHLDEDIHNNHVDNLKIISHQEHNEIHRTSNKPKLTLDEARTIRKQYFLANLSRAHISRLYKHSSPSAIDRVINCIDGYYEDFDDPIYCAVYYADDKDTVNTYDGGRIQKWRHPNK